MKKLLALVLSMLLVASCLAFSVIAAEDTTAESTDTTAAEGTDTAADEETTEGEAATYSNTVLVFNDYAKEKKFLGNQSGINKTFYKSDWEGARLKITNADDPYVYINWSNYISKTDGLEDIDSQSYPFVVFKLKIEGYVDDFELFYCAGDITGADPAYATTTDYPCMNTGEVEYIIYDLTGDCEGEYNQFRFDPMGCDEDTFIYLYELALFATEEEALAYAGYNQEETSEETTVETEPESETEEETTQAATKAPSTTKPVEEKKNCNSVMSVGALVAIVALGAVCIKKKD